DDFIEVRHPGLPGVASCCQWRVATEDEERQAQFVEVQELAGHLFVRADDGDADATAHLSNTGPEVWLHPEVIAVREGPLARFAGRIRRGDHGLHASDLFRRNTVQLCLRRGEGL